MNTNEKSEVDGDETAVEVVGNKRANLAIALALASLTILGYGHFETIPNSAIDVRMGQIEETVLGVSHSAADLKLSGTSGLKKLELRFDGVDELQSEQHDKLEELRNQYNTTAKIVDGLVKQVEFYEQGLVDVNLKIDQAEIALLNEDVSAVEQIGELRDTVSKLAVNVDTRNSYLIDAVGDTFAEMETQVNSINRHLADLRSELAVLSERSDTYQRELDSLDLGGKFQGMGLEEIVVEIEEQRN